MEAVFGRHQAEIRSVSGIYGSACEGSSRGVGGQSRDPHQTTLEQGQLALLQCAFVL